MARLLPFHNLQPSAQQLLSNLIPRAGFSPTTSGRSEHLTQWVQVQDFGSSPPAQLGNGSDDEIDLRELWRALVRRRKLVALTSASVIVLSGLLTAHQRAFAPLYEGSFSLLINDPISNDDSPNQTAIPQGGLIEQLAKNTTSVDIPTLIELLKSPVMLSPMAKQFGLTPEQLAQRITINSGGEKNKQAEGILNIRVSASNPKADQQLLEQLASTYLQAALTQRQQRLADGIRFLDRQAPALQQRTDALQQDLARFRERHNLLQPSEEGAALRQKAIGQGDVLRELQAERSRLLTVRRAIARGTITANGFEEAIGTGGSGQGSQGLKISDINQSLLSQLSKLEDQLADARARYTGNSSMVQGLEARRRQLLPLLRRNQLEAVDSALNLNGARLATGLQQQGQLNNAFSRQPQLIKQYEDLQQRLTIAQENLASFLKTRENFQLEIAQRTVPWRVIAPPLIDPNPVKPSIPRNLALGVLLGLVAGAGAGLVRDRFDHVFHTAREVEEDLRVPVLGHIPHVSFFKGVREDKRFLIEELDQGLANNGAASTDSDSKLIGYQRFFYQEAFRNLFTSLRFLSTDKPLRSIALTSSIPAEGKSLINVLLAKTLSEMGQRVLLVDGDLRKPQMHHRLGVNNLVGLSNLLTEDDLHWRQAMQRVANHDSWFVITAGRVPPDPARLLSSARMHQFVRELADSGEFDLIVYDTPPVVGLADAALIAEHLDGLMLLVSLDRVDRHMPKEAVARIRSSGAPLLGVVTNAVKEQKHEARAYGYGYGKYGYGQYGYGYGYGYGAYNTGSAYAYYANGDENGDGKAADPTPTKSLEPAATALQQLRKRINQFVTWVDR
jgi:capsular exopolysaccharide synthesis family protein